ncbi:MAG: iron-containing alcohol dehydrogenase [Chlorobiaceae bacterium]|nr:iron-containing alcohol dehydrogenase [Chlorobiaceae bacterium]
MSSEPLPVFSLLRLPALHFGAGSFSFLPKLVSGFGRNPMIVTGSRSLEASGRLARLFAELQRECSGFLHTTVPAEPTPELIDAAVESGRKGGTDTVIAIGGGSVIDAGKAVSAMLLQRHPVERFIEGRPGFLEHDGRKVPFLAVPTTSGTGSEATCNAVISRIGADGFKRSLRHPAFVPEIAVLDPELLCSAPRHLTASSGMDAFTQLMEAWVSPFASPYTDLLAFHGLEYFSRSFLKACSDGPADLAVRGDIAYAAFLSGAVLGNAGLGIVHGFASSVGGAFDIPHGVLCARLLSEATRENILLLQLSGSGSHALRKYAAVGRLLTGRAEAGTEEGCMLLVQELENWQSLLDIPRLGAYGIGAGDAGRLAGVTRSKSNPVDLGPESLEKILLACI